MWTLRLTENDPVTAQLAVAKEHLGAGTGNAMAIRYVYRSVSVDQPTERSYRAFGTIIGAIIFVAILRKAPA